MGTYADYLYQKAVRDQLRLEYIVLSDEEPILVKHGLLHPDFFTSEEWEKLALGNERVQTKKGLYVRTSKEEILVGADEEGLSPYMGKTLRVVCYTHENTSS